MDRTRRAEAARQRFPWAPRAQHIQDGRHRVPVIHPWASILPFGGGWWEDTHHLCSEGIRHLIVGAHPNAVVVHLGSLLTVNGGPKYTGFITFRIDS